jgi:hypothetical protein
MAAHDVDELLAEIRRLPLAERTRLLERAAIDLAGDTPKPPSASGPSLIGLMSDAPELVDTMCALVYEARAKARMRSVG